MICVFFVKSPTRNRHSPLVCKPPKAVFVERSLQNRLEERWPEEPEDSLKMARRWAEDGPESFEDWPGGPEGPRDGMEDGTSMAQSFEDGAKMGQRRPREVSKMAQRGPIERTQDGRERGP